jgi:hypothetical protein
LYFKNRAGNHYGVRKFSIRALWTLSYYKDDFEVKNLLNNLRTSDPDLAIRNYINTLHGVDQGLIRLEYPKKDMTGSTRLKLKFSKSSNPVKILPTPMEYEEEIKVEDSEDSLSATEENPRHLKKSHKHKKSRSSKTKKEGKQSNIEPEAIKQLIATIEESLIETEVALPSKKRKKKSEKLIDTPIHISSSRKRKSAPAVEEIVEVEKKSKKLKKPKK